MNVGRYEEIWAYSNSGTKVHAFVSMVEGSQNHKRALCRKTITRNVDATFMAQDEVSPSPVCPNCLKRAMEMWDRAEASMQPATEADDLGYVAPAPEGFTQGQPVVVQHPGRPPFTGTVAHIHTAPGYVAVRDDRRGDVVNHPTRFVSAAETETEADDLGYVAPVDERPGPTPADMNRELLRQAKAVDEARRMLFPTACTCGHSKVTSPAPLGDDMHAIGCPVRPARSADMDAVKDALDNQAVIDALHAEALAEYEADGDAIDRAIREAAYGILPPVWRRTR